jgi:PAS domain S-box-containing protein
MGTKKEKSVITDNRFYKNVIESLEDYCVFTTDPDGRTTSWNTGAQNILGYTEEEVIGLSAEIFFIEEDILAGKPAKELEIALNEGRAVNERWHVKKDKSVFWGSGMVFPLRDEDDQLQGFIKVMRDQTVQVQMTRALEDERTKLEKIFENAPTFLTVFLGSDFVFERVNEAYTQLCGRKDLVGKRLLDVMPYVQGQEWFIKLSEVFNTGKPYSGKEVKATFYHGNSLQPEDVYLNLLYLPQQDINGNITGVVAHGYEVTDQILARLYMEEASKAQAALQQQKEEFIGIASHELKTPVTSLKAYSQFVEGTLRKDGLTMQANLVGKMSNQIEKLQNLITDLLDVTKINGGKLQFNDDFFDFNEMLVESIEDLQRTTQTHEIVTRLEPIGQVWADRFRISQVLTNLITNGIKYSPDSKSILVTSHLQNGEVIVSVEDTGIGISEKHQQNLFDRFYRVSGTRENIFTGLGLGLYISAEIIKQEGGRIWVNSTEGKGSTFCFALPMDRRLKGI